MKKRLIRWMGRLCGDVARFAGAVFAPQEEYFLPKVSDVVREARRLKAY